MQLNIQNRLTATAFYWCVMPCLLATMALSSVSVSAQTATSSNAKSSESQKPSRSDFVSDASHVIGTFVPAKRDHSPAALKSSAEAFLDSLSDEQRKKCVADLKSPMRREWTNLPPREDADGVKVRDLSNKQFGLACQLMANLLSEQGFNKMRDVMLADDLLLRNGQPGPRFGAENFSIVIFGQPSETEPWAFQLDGHHVGVNLSMKGESMTMSPSFIGTQPHAFTIAGTEFKPFKNETGLAHKLAISLTDDQVRKAVIGNARAKIITGPGQDGLIPPTRGLPCSDLNEDQQAILFDLISQWVGDLPKPLADSRMKKIRSELGSMKFAWNGDRKSMSDVSYIIQSPSVIIEYACQDLGGNPLDHLHSNYRNPKNEYGGVMD